MKVTRSPHEKDVIEITRSELQEMLKGYIFESSGIEVKMEMQPDMVFYGQIDDAVRGRYSMNACFTRHQEDGDKIKLTFDGNTGKLKRAEVINHAAD